MVSIDTNIYNGLDLMEQIFILEYSWQGGYTM